MRRWYLEARALNAGLIARWLLSLAIVSSVCGVTYSPDSPRQVWIQAADTRTSALRISPVRGSTFDGPTA